MRLFGHSTSFVRLLSLIVIFSLFSPIIGLAEVRVTAQSSPPILLPEILTTPPEPFVSHSSGSLLSFLGTWEQTFSLFGSVLDKKQNSFLSFLNECPGGYKSLGGNLVSDPTAVAFKDKVLVFARGTDNALYYLVLEKGNKSNWISLGGNSISNPASFFNETTLFVEVFGADNQKHYRSTTDGVTFTEWQQGSVNALTTSANTGIRGSSLTFVKGKGENPPICYQVVKGKKEPKSNNGNQNNSQPNGDEPIVAMRAPDECEWDPWCEPPPPPGDQYSPVGWFDGIDGNSRTVNGWSYDPDNPGWSNDVHVYINGPAGSGAGYAVTANLPRPDVNQAFGITGDHGFSFQIPAQYADGQQHIVYAYGIDTGANSNSLLNGSPKYFTFNPPPPATPTWWTINVISQTQLDVYWNAAANATGYNVRMDGNQIQTNIPYTSIPVTNLAPGSTHTFEVQAVNQWGVSSWSSSRSGTTQAAPPPPLPLPVSGNYYQVIARHSNKCVDVWGGVGATNNGAEAKQYSCVGQQQTNQIWKFTQVGDAWELRAAHSGKCLDVSGVSQSDGATIWQWDCHSGLNQL